MTRIRKGPGRVKSDLIISEYPLIVLPSLATAIGLNEAIVLQQIHYWLNQSKHIHDGEKWIYNTQDEWQEQFPFWSLATVKRTLSSLKAKKLIKTGNYNQTAFDRTTWYTIDYDAVSELSSSANCANGAVQDEPMEERSLSGPIPETNAETPQSKNDDPQIMRFWGMTLEGVELPDKLAHDVDRLTPRSWADGVLTLHAPADVARRLRRRTGELLERLKPVAHQPLVEVRIVNGA